MQLKISSNCGYRCELKKNKQSLDERQQTTLMSILIITMFMSRFPLDYFHVTRANSYLFLIQFKTPWAEH